MQNGVKDILVDIFSIFREQHAFLLLVKYRKTYSSRIRYLNNEKYSVASLMQ